MSSTLCLSPTPGKCLSHILISGRGRAFPPSWPPRCTAEPEKFPEIIAVNDRNEIEEIRALLAITPLPAFLLVNCLIPNESSGRLMDFLMRAYSDASFPPLPGLIPRQRPCSFKNAILKNQKYSAQQKEKGT